MDQQHHAHPMGENQGQQNLPQYGLMYPNEQDPAYTMGGYNAQMPPYGVVQQQQQQHPGPPPRQLSAGDMQQNLQFHNMSLMSGGPTQPYPPNVYPSALPPSASPPPQSPTMYDPLSPPVSGSDSSTDGGGLYHHSHSRSGSGAGSPSSSRSSSLVHRTNMRYNPTPSPTSSSGRRRGHSADTDDDDDALGIAASTPENLAFTRKEATRKQRIEAEQRRRDELRDGYAKLKNVLPVSNQKNSKVSLLDRATTYIGLVEAKNRELTERVRNLEDEVKRLALLVQERGLGSVDTPSPANTVSMHVDAASRPLSPPPEKTPLSHSLTSVQGQQPPREDSKSPSSEQ